MMVCKPFDYKEFCKKEKLIKNLFIGAGFCLIASSDQLVELAFEIYYTAMDDEKDPSIGMILRFSHKNIHFGIDVFNFVKIMVTKMVFSVAVARLAWLTRSGLITSDRTSKRNTRMYNRLFYFSLIPLFLNVIFTVHEVLNLLVPILDTENPLSTIPFPDESVIARIQVSVITFGSLTYCMAYLILFSNVRNIFLCKA